MAVQRVAGKWIYKKALTKNLKVHLTPKIWRLGTGTQVPVPVPRHELSPNRRPILQKTHWVPVLCSIRTFYSFLFTVFGNRRSEVVKSDCSEIDRWRPWVGSRGRARKTVRGKTIGSGFWLTDLPEKGFEVRLKLGASKSVPGDWHIFWGNLDSRSNFKKKGGN